MHEAEPVLQMKLFNSLEIVADKRHGRSQTLVMHRRPPIATLHSSLIMMIHDTAIHFLTDLGAFGAHFSIPHTHSSTFHYTNRPWVDCVGLHTCPCVTELWHGRERRA